MDRVQKISILKELKSGKKSFNDVFPKKEIFFIVDENGNHFAEVLGNYKSIKPEDEENLIRQMKADYPDHLIEVCRISQEQFVEISNLLETEC